MTDFRADNGMGLPDMRCVVCGALLPVLFIACGASETGATAGNDGDPSFGQSDAQASSTDLDPITCEEAEQTRSYVGCDYWPTAMPNLVTSVFDFAVAVANIGAEGSRVTVTGPNGFKTEVTVSAGSLEKIYLPWVEALKGTDDAPMVSSTVARAAAYHLTSSRPVVVYQFSPLEFKNEGGPPGKDWSECIPADGATDCYSYSNDASLLLPSTAMTGSYRVMGLPGLSAHPKDPSTGAFDTTRPIVDLLPANFAVTATRDGTTVTVKLGGAATIVSGGAILMGRPGDTFTLTLSAGDVALVTTKPGTMHDPSGSLVSADKPVQVISGVACIYMPFEVVARRLGAQPRRFGGNLLSRLYPISSRTTEFVLRRGRTRAVQASASVTLFGGPLVELRRAVTHSPNGAIGRACGSRYRSTCRR